jgi:S1-C subfamily serine protease
VSAAALTPEITHALDLKVTTGVLIRSVVDGGPADESALRAGDVITSLNGRPIRGLEEFLSMMRRLDPGDRIKVEYNRNGRTTTVEVTLDRLDPTTSP